MTTPVVTPDSTEQVAEPTQDQTTVTEPVAQPESQGAGPWANDLAQMFSDEATRNQVDQFLRDKVQPHVTQLEQSRAELQDAGQLYEALQSDPAETYLALTEDIFGTQTADTIRNQLISIYSDNNEEENEQETDYGNEQQNIQLPPEVQELLAERQAAKEAAEYKSQMDAAVAQHADIVPDLFHPFVAAAEGDFDVAYQGYSNWLGQAKAQFGAQPTEEPAPNTLGSDTAGSTTPPVEKKYTSIDEALTDTLAEIRAAQPAPTVVGSA